jgi:hypothetical protein
MTDDGKRPSTRRHRDFLLLWGGQTVSEMGTHVTVLALPLVAVVLLDASAFEVGLLTAAETSAYLLVALPAGSAARSLPVLRVVAGLADGDPYPRAAPAPGRSRPAAHAAVADP